MPYTPEVPGILTIHLRAWNNVHSLIIKEQIFVENLLKSANLYAVPRDTFINKTVTLMASGMPRSTSVKCLWDFGDNSSQVHTNTTSVGYKYRLPGRYQVQVCIISVLIFHLIVARYNNFTSAVCESLISSHICDVCFCFLTGELQ